MDFGLSSGGGGGKEDKKALLERARAEREARARTAVLSAKAVVLQRWTRRIVGRARARSELRSRLDQAWAVYTTALARRTATLKEQPEFEAGLFVAEGAALERVARWIALLERCKTHTAAAGEGLLILDDAESPARHARPPRVRAPSKSAQALQSADDLKQLSLCAAIVKGTMDKSTGAERHNFFGGAALEPIVADAAAATASPRAASSASAVAAPSVASLSGPSWIRCCASLVRVLLARLLRDCAAGTPKDVKSFALITSCLCTILDPTRWNVPGASAASLAPPAAAAAVSASAIAAPSAPSKPVQPQLSATISACYKELMLHLLLRGRLFTHMRRLLMQLCYPPAAPVPVVAAVSISAPSSSASSKATAAATAAAVALVVSQRPVAFVNALLTSCVRVVELCSFLPPSAPAPSRSVAPSSAGAVPFLLAEPAYLFAAHILSIPACHSALTPAMVATITSARSSTAATPAAVSAPASLWSVLYSALHQLLVPSAYQSGSYFLSRAPPPVFLDGAQWARLQQALPSWSTYDSIVLSAAAGSHGGRGATCEFNVPPQIHVLSTLCWLTIHHAPLSGMDSLQLHLWMSVSAALLRCFPPVLLGVADSGRLDLISLLSEREDDESRFERAHGSLDNTPPALFVRAAMITQLEVLFRQSSIATVMNHVFLGGHAALEEAGDGRLGSLDAFKTRLKAFGLIDAAPSETELFMRAFHAYTSNHPLYFSALLTLLKSLTSLRSSSVSGSSSSSAAASSKMLRTNGLSWLTFSTPFLACVWEELQRRMGCELSEEGSFERMDGALASSAAAGAPGSKDREKKESASAALRAFFGFKSSSSAASSSASSTETVFVTNRNRWEVAILTSRGGGSGGGSSPSQQQQGVEAGVTDLFLLWLSFFAPILFILEDSELLSKLPALSPPRVGTLVSLVHLLKMIVFRLIYNKYEPRRGRGSQSQVDYDLYADLLGPAQTLLRELYQRDVRRGFMHLAEVERTELAKAAAREAAATKAEAAAERKRKPQASAASYAALETEMDSLSPAAASAVAASSMDPSSLLSAPAPSITDAASLDARAQHWMLSSGAAGLASRSELATFEREFEIWARGGIGADGDASAELFDPSSTHSQRLFHLLHAMPFILSFSRREALLRSFIRADSLKHGYSASDAAPARPLFEITLRRDHVVADGLAAVSRLGVHFRSKLRVKFLESSGAEERGIDLGGPFKEFLEQVTREVFRVEYGLWTKTEPESNGAGGAQGMYYPSPSAPFLHGPESARDLFVSIGRIVGKALYDNILLDIPLASFFLARIIGQGLVLADLQEMDHRLFKSLMQVKNYPGDVSDLCLNFTVSRGEMEQGATTAAASSSSSSSAAASDPNVVELLSNGASVDVTNANRMLYVYKYADYHLSQKLSLVVGAFLSGLGDIVDLRWFRLFNTAEMRMILSGNMAHTISTDDWRAHTVYEEGCSAQSKVVLWFWEVVVSMTESEKSALLKFATSCSRPPLQGFKDLHPPFTIRVIPVVEAPPSASGSGKSGGFFRSLFSSRPNAAQLPSAATCFNTLKLPKYASKSILAEKLKMAIQNNTGFHLT